jgi:hypothetical protein
MTLTAPTSTSPAVDAAVFGIPDPFDAVRADDWIASVDANHSGQLHLGVIAAVIALVSGLGVAVHGDLAGWWNLNETGSFSLGSVFALHQNLWAVSLAMPIWIAVATMVVPRQLGAARSAFPRLANLAVWAWIVGTILLVVASVVDDGPTLVNVLDSVAANATAGEAPRATDLALAAIMLITVATLAGAINLFATVLTEREPGIRLSTMRPFSWSVLVTMGIAIVSTPVFLAGTFLLYLDQHFGGQFFASGIGADRVWIHAIWLFGRPEAVLVAIPAVGAVADVIVSRTGKALIGGGAANALIALAAGTSILTWTGRELIGSSLTAPYARWWNALILAPLFLLLLLIAGSARSGLKPDVSLLGALGVILTVVAGAALVIGVVAGDPKNGLASQLGVPNLLVFGLVLLGAVTILVEQSGSVYPRALPKPVATLIVLAMLGGVLLTGAALGFGAFGDADATGPHAAAAIGKAMIAGGAALLILAVLPFARPAAASEGTH